MDWVESSAMQILCCVKGVQLSRFCHIKCITNTKLSYYQQVGNLGSIWIHFYFATQTKYDFCEMFSFYLFLFFFSVIY